MKSNLKEGWLPRWFTRMPKKHRIVEGVWMPWKSPTPLYDPTITNKQRFHANPLRHKSVTTAASPDLEPSTPSQNATNDGKD